MTVYTLGSINIDHVYRVPHLVAPGETLAARDYSVGLGGKGANQSVAAARAGARVIHIGAVGPEGGWALDQLARAGVDIAAVVVTGDVTGHAIISVDDAGENAILLCPGANRVISAETVAAALAPAGPGDTLLLQNETAQQDTAARIAQGKGMRVIYSAAPFDAEAVRAVLPHLTILIVNAVEAAQLCEALGCGLEAIPVPEILVTRGRDGAEWHSPGTGEHMRQPAFPVVPVDSTGAGDTFAGYFAAARDAGTAPAGALRQAAAAAALMVTRRGTAEAIPTGADVAEFLSRQA